MKKQIPIGISDFRQLRTENYHFVDKSLLIKEVLNDSATVVLLTRPRRFGKTLNLSMLRYFFEQSKTTEQNRTLFSGLAIENEPEFETHFGKYPVIFITFKDIKERNYETSVRMIQNVIAEEFRRFRFLAESERLNEEERHNFLRVCKQEAHFEAYLSAIKDLSCYLAKHYGVNPIILIDEYDTPIHTAYTENYYKDMIAFFKAFYGSALKDNVYLQKAVMTGILRVSRESIFSELNNVAVYSILSHSYSNKFGFTETEVQQLLTDNDLLSHFSVVKEWYNGYVFGKTIIYNPWSILNYTARYDEGAKPHWVNTASNDLIRELVQNGPSSLQEEFEMLLKNIPLKKRLNENIVFNDLKNDDTTIYSFLVFSGYLKAVDKEHIDKYDYYNLFIPNVEVEIVFHDIIQHWLNHSFDSNTKLRMLLKAVVEGDAKLFEKLLSEFVLKSLSYFMTCGKNIESVYQAFILGMLINLEDRYDVSSEREAGYGRYDIAIIPKDLTQKGIIMELKIIDEFENETKDEALKNAMLQIEDRQYEIELRRRGVQNIVKMAVTFDGKRVWAVAK